MPDKARERFHLEALRKALVKFPSGDVHEFESPDFLVVSKGHRLGIELTTFHVPPVPGEHQHHEQHNLQQRIVEKAKRQHQEAGGPALYVEVIFHEHPPLTKKDTEPLGRAIADAVLNSRVPSSFKEPPAEIHYGHRPKRVAGIQVYGSVDGVERLWDADDTGGWVAQITPEHVLQVVRDKAERAPRARSRCDELWLVIVNDDVSGAAPANISNEALEATYEAPFDRLIWLLPHTPLAIDLRLRPPAV